MEDKIDKVLNISNSQLDRNRIKEESFVNLMTFMNVAIMKASTQNRLKEKVEALLLERIEDEDEEIPYGVLIKLIEILGKNEVDASIPILKIIEQANKQPEPSLPENPTRSGKENSNSGISGEEVKKVKNILKIIDNLEKSEFSEDEKNKNKEK